MNETLTAEKPGTVETSPETEARHRGRPAAIRPANPPEPPPPKPQVAYREPEIKWVSKEESERLDKLIGKDFVRKVERPDAKSRDFFYRVISACPYVPRGVLTNKTQSMVTFNLQKFHRNRFVTKNAIVGGKQTSIQENESAQWVRQDPETGDFEVIDPDANFAMDSREFEQNFKRDTED
jgi:hypothetical protein